MPPRTRMRHALIISMTMIALVFASVIISYGETAVNYIYDELNRLKRVEYGDGTVVEYTYDKAGNRLGLIVDATAPTTTASPPGGIYPPGQTVTLQCYDAGGLGCDKIYYTTDGSAPTTSSSIYSVPIPVSNTTLKFFATDLAGHSEAVKTEIYTVDAVLPTGTITINSGAASTNNRNVTLTLSCSDTNGCSEMQFSNDDITYSTPEAYGTTKAWTLSAGDGTKIVYVKFKDTPGNWSIAYNDTILFDVTPPTTTASPVGGVYASAQSVTLGCNDGAGGGCDKIYYTTDGSTPTTSSSIYSVPIPVSNTTLKFFATDLAGNAETVKTEIYIIGKVRIGGTPYSSIQAAYDVASSGDAIKCRDQTFVENLTVNRNITITLEGGYDAGFTTNYGTMTILKGMIQTTSGGGTITIKNFVLEK